MNRQCSKRGGSLEVRHYFHIIVILVIKMYPLKWKVTLEGDSLLVRGNAVTVIRGTLSISV